MTKPTKEIPRFENEAEERKFWESHDSADFLDWSLARSVTLPNSKPTTRVSDILCNLKAGSREAPQ